MPHEDVYFPLFVSLSSLDTPASLCEECDAREEREAWVLREERNRREADCRIREAKLEGESAPLILLRRPPVALDGVVADGSSHDSAS